MGKSLLVIIDAEHAPDLLPAARELLPRLQWWSDKDKTTGSNEKTWSTFSAMTFDENRSETEDADDVAVVARQIATEMREPYVVLVGYGSIEDAADLSRALAGRLTFYLDNNHNPILTGEAAAAALAADPRWLIGRA